MKKPPVSLLNQDEIKSSLLKSAVSKYGVKSLEFLTLEAALSKALWDARLLDEHSKSVGRKEVFLQRLLHALATDQSAAARLLAYGQVRLDKKGMREVFLAWKRGEDGAPQMAAYEFRASLRDGWTPSQAVTINSAQLAEYSRKGDVSLILAMADAIKTHKRKPEEMQWSNEAWLLRAWMPLVLWNCKAAEIDRRVREAASLLKQVGGFAQQVPTGKALDTLARKVRNTLKQGRR